MGTRWRLNKAHDVPNLAELTQWQEHGDSHSFMLIQDEAEVILLVSAGKSSFIMKDVFTWCSKGLKQSSFCELNPNMIY